MSVAELAQRFYASWGLPLEWAHDSAAGAPEARHLTLDAGKAVRRLRWASHVSNDDAIDWTVEWYKAWRSGRSPEAITADQIARYQDGRA